MPSADIEGVKQRHRREEREFQELNEGFHLNELEKIAPSSILDDIHLHQETQDPFLCRQRLHQSSEDDEMSR